MSTSVEAAVLAANAAFYTAFRHRDIVTMLSLWCKQGPVSCVHPGWPPMTDRRQVLKSWADILSNPGSPSVHCEAEQVLILAPGVATVLSVEMIGGQALAATNVFVLEDAQWRLSHHQASPMAGSFDPAEEETPPPGSAVH